ncbi:MAG: DUF1015 domain-containing protein [Candidatus Omnitrophota bacterium]
MARIEPFVGIHYNPAVVEDVSLVVCPPYDIISPKKQEDCYQKHSYNIIRLILGKDFGADSEKDNKYTRAAGYLQEWLRRGILTQDPKPSFYFYEQGFIQDGKPRMRLGVLTLMRLDEEGQKTTVYPHEHTHKAPKEDRLSLIKSVEANLSPIFTVYSDPQSALKKLFREHVAVNKPLFDIKEQDEEGQTHKLWPVSDEGLVNKVRDLLSEKELFIADGHHRYEVARMFREYKRSHDAARFKDSYNYIMSYVTPLEDEGLCILPTHRLVKNAAFSLDVFSSCFDVKEMASQEDLVAAMKAREDEVGVFGLYKHHAFYLLKLSEKRECNRLIQEGPKEYKNLDVVILHKVVFDHLCKVPLEDISYEVNLSSAVSQVDSGAFGAVFVLNPTKMEQIRSIALGGEVMPQKSTYFYPKLLSGLVINAL